MLTDKVLIDRRKRSWKTPPKQKQTIKEESKRSCKHSSLDYKNKHQALLSSIFFVLMLEKLDKLFRLDDF